jgi:dihydroorotate dehydrogenase
LTRSFYRTIAKPAMFLTPPETAHSIAKFFFKRDWLWRIMNSHLCIDDERLHTSVGHLELPNPVGLAAGFDKNCEMFNSLFSVGFGYLTLGTVTLNPREGNPKPRVWRYPENSLVNSMGLPNDGAGKIARNLQKQKTGRGRIIVSISGLSVEEFTACYRAMESLADGVELNISTPNTVGVRIFQDPAVLTSLLDSINAVRKRGKPVWVKVPPYFDEEERENVLDLVKICVNKSVDAITAANTKMVSEPRASIGTGGLSGPLIFEDMLRIVADIHHNTQGKIPINACGGISSGINAWRAFEVGASSIQLYTALIFQGPSIVAKINKELLDLLRSSKLKSISQVVGSGLK